MRTHLFVLAALSALSHAFVPSERTFSRPRRLESTQAAATPTLPADATVVPLRSVKDLQAQIELSRDEDSPLMLVKYFAKNCRACRTIAPRYQKLAKQLGDQAVCFEMEQTHWREHEKDLGIVRLPTIHVYAGELIVEDLVCGPAQFGKVKSKIANDLACDPRSETPCDLVYDDKLGPIPDFSDVGTPTGYSTDFNTLKMDPQAIRRVRLEALGPSKLPRGTRLKRATTGVVTILTLVLSELKSVVKGEP